MIRIMKPATKYLLALITTLVVVNLSVAEARSTSGMAALANKGDKGDTGATGPAGVAGVAGVAAPVHIVGESYQGGIIFWVDPDGQHGLIAARADLNVGAPIEWYNGIYFATNATADGIYAGAKNTEVIVAAQATVGFICAYRNSPPFCEKASIPTAVRNYAALAAANYSVQDDGVTVCASSNPPVGEICYGDWYLPSKVELNLLYAQKTVVGGFANFFYWSSTENNSHNAWYQNFDSGYQDDGNKGNALPVRAVRAF